MLEILTSPYGLLRMTNRISGPQNDILIVIIISGSGDADYVADSGHGCGEG